MGGEAEIVVGRKRNKLLVAHPALGAVPIERHRLAISVDGAQAGQLALGPGIPVGHAVSSSAAASVATMRSISAAVMVSGGTIVMTGPMERASTPRLTIAVQVRRASLGSSL